MRGERHVDEERVAGGLAVELVRVDAVRLGTVKRANGSLQATYAGRPLYYYVGDTKPGQILCQNVTEFGGVWRVLRPDGRLVA